MCTVCKFEKFVFYFLLCHVSWGCDFVKTLLGKYSLQVLIS